MSHNLLTLSGFQSLNCLSVGCVGQTTFRPSDLRRSQSSPILQAACEELEPAAPDSIGKVMSTTRSRPWRKSKAECQAERDKVDQVLSQSSQNALLCPATSFAGVDPNALLFSHVAQELLDSSARPRYSSNAVRLAAEGSDDFGISDQQWPSSSRSSPRSRISAARAAVEHLRQAATNALPAADIDEARKKLVMAMNQIGLSEALNTQLQSPLSTKYDTCHRILPGLWLGGWNILDNNGAELRKRCITHVVSVISTELPPQRHLPNFVKKHLHIRADDREDAAQGLGEHFPDICSFVDAARAEPKGCVLVHCGAGISRAPTAAACYIMWKIGVSAATALKMITSVRPSVRPNLGFVRELCGWEAKLRAAADNCGTAAWTPPCLTPARALVPSTIAPPRRSGRLPKARRTLSAGMPMMALQSNAALRKSSATAGANRFCTTASETSGSWRRRGH